jgi:hypothetical protein
VESNWDCDASSLSEGPATKKGRHIHLHSEEKKPNLNKLLAVIKKIPKEIIQAEQS